MIWASWSDFFAMGGYALYVWGSVLVTFACLAVEIIALRMRRTSLLEQHRRWQRTTDKERKESK
jgi:heme exporter protein D